MVPWILLGLGAGAAALASSRQGSAPKKTVQSSIFVIPKRVKFLARTPPFVTKKDIALVTSKLTNLSVTGPWDTHAGRGLCAAYGIIPAGPLVYAGDGLALATATQLWLERRINDRDASAYVNKLIKRAFVAGMASNWGKSTGNAGPWDWWNKNPAYLAALEWLAADWKNNGASVDEELVRLLAEAIADVDCSRTYYGEETYTREELVGRINRDCGQQKTAAEAKLNHAIYRTPERSVSGWVKWGLFNLRVPWPGGPPSQGPMTPEEILKFVKAMWDSVYELAILVFSGGQNAPEALAAFSEMASQIADISNETPEENCEECPSCCLPDYGLDAMFAGAC